MNWLTEVVESFSESEAPRSFWYWSALCAISAVVKDNIFFDKFYYKLYPNIYVLLYADSGLKKGPPINFAHQLVKQVNNTRIINGRSSIQGILKKLGTAETKPGGHILKSSCGFICSSELASSLVEDKAALTIMTDLYDRNYRAGDWESLLKMESFSLHDPTVTLFGGINEAHSMEFFTRKDVQGGFFARTFIIHESQAQTVNSLMFQPKVIPDVPKLSNYLKQLAQFKGEILMSEDNRKHFDIYYRNLREMMRVQHIKDPTGTLNRFDDSILKTAILIALGRHESLTIEREDIDEAIQ